ncbi:MAG: hypothetical protein K6C40_08760 [Thermoguttaceae bacterium]|nr:hypothetical protein [Thermoguttaceae bacterium]
MQELEMAIQKKESQEIEDQETEDQEKKEASTRSYNLLIVLLIILLGVTVFVAYVNLLQPKWFIDWRDKTLSELNIQNPFAVPDETIVDPDKIPDALKEADAKTCAELEKLGAIVIRDTLTKMGSVVHLNAETNSDEAQELMGKLIYLNAINVADANLTDEQTQNWINLDHCTSLNIQGNHGITSASLENISEMAGLDGVYLENTSISGENLEKLLKLTNVKILNMSGCKLKDEDMKVLGQMKSIHWLLLNDMELTDECLPAFMDMPNLKTITIMKGNNISREAAQKFEKDFFEKNQTKVQVD